MSFVSMGNKSVGNGGPAISTPPVAGENVGISVGSAAAGVTGATKQAVESLFSTLP